MKITKSIRLNTNPSGTPLDTTSPPLTNRPFHSVIISHWQVFCQFASSYPLNMHLVDMEWHSFLKSKYHAVLSKKPYKNLSKLHQCNYFFSQTCNLRKNQIRPVWQDLYSIKKNMLGGINYIPTLPFLFINFCMVLLYLTLTRTKAQAPGADWKGSNNGVTTVARPATEATTAIPAVSSALTAAVSWGAEPSCYASVDISLKSIVCLFRSPYLTFLNTCTIDFMHFPT